MMTSFSALSNPYLPVLVCGIAVYDDLIFSPGYDPYLSSQVWGLGLHDDCLILCLLSAWSASRLKPDEVGEQATAG